MENSKWSKNWEHFNWDEVAVKLEKAKQSGPISWKEHPDIGITAEEFLEYLDWLREEKSLLEWQYLTMGFLEKSGVPKEEIYEVFADPKKQAALANKIKDMVREHLQIEDKLEDK